MFGILSSKYFTHREDAQTWRERLTSKRIVTSDPEIAAYDGWKTTDWTIWEPRIYFCTPIGQGLDKDLNFQAQETCLLLQLPAELRIRILEFVLPPAMIAQKTKSVSMRLGDAKWKNTTAIIFTCKQLYVEGRALALEMHTFSYDRFPKKTRLCALNDRDRDYSWDVLNVVCDTKTNVVKQVFYR